MDDEFLFFTPGPKPSQMPGDVEIVTYRRQLTSARNEVLWLGNKRIPMQSSQWVILQQSVPNWNSKNGHKNGHLTWKGKKIGEFRLCKKRTVPEQILSAFQELKWPQEIDNPLGLDKKNCLEAYQFVHYLNEAIAKGTIRFHVRRGGKAITWKSMENTSEV